MRLPKIRAVRSINDILAHLNGGGLSPSSFFRPFYLYFLLPFYHACLLSALGGWALDEWIKKENFGTMEGKQRTTGPKNRIEDREGGLDDGVAIRI